MNYQQAYYELKNGLRSLYDEQEASAITHEFLGYLTGKSKLERLTGKEILLSESLRAKYDWGVHQLLQGRPLQYVTGETIFSGRIFKVDERALIPRPETEELVEWVVEDWKNKMQGFSILDIGTGSGCIAVTLKLALEKSVVDAIDISIDALDLASANASRLGAMVGFSLNDILSSKSWPAMPVYDVLISNPPYIPESEKTSLHKNVKDHEPPLALFTPSDDPLLFYRMIAGFGKMHLQKSGAIYCEIHASHAHDTEALFIQMGYTVELRKDMHGNWRMLKAGMKRLVDLRIMYLSN